MSNDILHYRPPGWTEERVSRADPDDLLSLPEDQRTLLYARIDAHYQRAISGETTKALHAARNEKRVAAGLDPIPEPSQSNAPRPPQFVEVVQRAGIADDEEWGFVILAGPGAKGADWDEALRRYNELATAGMMAELRGDGGGDANNDVGKWRQIVQRGALRPVEGERARGVGFEGGRMVVGEDVEKLFASDAGPSSDIGKGFARSMCLVADGDAVASVLDKGKDSIAWVWAVDLTLGSDERGADGYPGYWKVNVEAVLTDLFVGVSLMEPRELWRPDKEYWDSWMVLPGDAEGDQMVKGDSGSHY